MRFLISRHYKDNHIRLTFPDVERNKFISIDFFDFKDKVVSELKLIPGVFLTTELYLSESGVGVDYVLLIKNKYFNKIMRSKNIMFQSIEQLKKYKEQVMSDYKKWNVNSLRKELKQLGVDPGTEKDKKKLISMYETALEEEAFWNEDEEDEYIDYEDEELDDEEDEELDDEEDEDLGDEDDDEELDDEEDEEDIKPKSKNNKNKAKTETKNKNGGSKMDQKQAKKGRGTKTNEAEVKTKKSISKPKKKDGMSSSEIMAQIKKKNLWKKGIQFLSNEEKLIILNGSAQARNKVYKKLEKKNESINSTLSDKMSGNNHWRNRKSKKNNKKK